MTAEAWTIAIFAYLISGGLVALWLWPIRQEQSGGDELLRGMICVGWPCALLAVLIMLSLRGCGGFVSWCQRRRRRVYYRIGLKWGWLDHNEVRKLEEQWRRTNTPSEQDERPLPGLKPPRPWPERRP